MQFWKLHFYPQVSFNIFVSNMFWYNEWLLLQGNPTEVDSWKLIKHHFPRNNAGFKAVWDRAADPLLGQILSSLMAGQCRQWAEEDRQHGFDWTGLPPVPCNIRQARRDPNFYQVGKIGMGSQFHNVFQPWIFLNEKTIMVTQIMQIIKKFLFIFFILNWL